MLQRPSNSSLCRLPVRHAQYISIEPERTSAQCVVYLNGSRARCARIASGSSHGTPLLPQRPGRNPVKLVPRFPSAQHNSFFTSSSCCQGQHQTASGPAAKKCRPASPFPCTCPQFGYSKKSKPIMITSCPLPCWLKPILLKPSPCTCGSSSSIAPLAEVPPESPELCNCHKIPALAQEGLSKGWLGVFLLPFRFKRT